MRDDRPIICLGLTSLPHILWLTLIQSNPTGLVSAQIKVAFMTPVMAPAMKCSQLGAPG